MNFLEKTLASITSTIQTSLYAQDFSRKKGFLQSLDPRTKILMVVISLLAISLARKIEILLGLYILFLLIAVISQLAIKNFILRVWLFLPFFTGIIALPILFNILSPGPKIITIVNTPQFQLSITSVGISKASNLIFRVADSVSAGMLLILTTPWADILKALAVFRIPTVFILILGMTYRYIFILLTTVTDMMLARRSRLTGPALAGENHGWIGSSVGILFSKSFQQSDEVYLAMRSRGFCGEPKTLSVFRFRIIDGFTIIICIIIFTCILYFD